MSETITAAELEAQFGLTVDAEFVPWSKSRSFDPALIDQPGRKNLNWRVTLKHKGREVLTTDYSAGIGHAPSYKNHDTRKHGCRLSLLHAQYLDHEVEKGTEGLYLEGFQSFMGKGGPPILPDPVDVIASLVKDGDAIDSPTYEEWAGNYGYDEDSRKGEAIYRQCLETGLKIRAALGDGDLARLQTALEDY